MFPARSVQFFIRARQVALCLVVLPGVLACGSSQEHQIEPRAQQTGRHLSVAPEPPRDPVRASAPPTPPNRSQEPDDMLLTTREVRAQCDPGHIPCRNGLYYSAALALADGTVLAATDEEGMSKGPLEILRPDGTRCHAPIRCSAVLSAPSGEIWCIERQTTACDAGAMHSGPTRPQLGYTRDGGMTWQVAEVDAGALKFGRASAPTADGILLADDLSGRVWSARTLASTSEIRLHPASSPPPGFGGAEVTFFAPERVCAVRNDFGARKPFEGTLDCLATGSTQWVELGDTKLVAALSTQVAWWALDNEHRLFRSSFDPSRWVEVNGGPGLEVDALTRQGTTNGDIYVFARQRTSSTVLRIDASGGIVERLVNLPKVSLTAFGAEGGRLALGGPEGIYVLQRSSWRQAMPACGAH